MTLLITVLFLHGTRFFKWWIHFLHWIRLLKIWIYLFILKIFILNWSFQKTSSLFSYWTSLLEIQKCGSFIIIFSGMLFFKNYCARAKSPTNMLIYVIIYYGHWRQNRRKLFDKLCFECHMILHNCNEYKIHNSNYFSLIRMTLSH